MRWFRQAGGRPPAWTGRAQVASLLLGDVGVEVVAEPTSGVKPCELGVAPSPLSLSVTTAMVIGCTSGTIEALSISTCSACS